MPYEPVATDCVANSGRSYSLINSVAFHPRENVFCATFSSRSLLNLYCIEAGGRVRVLQKVHGSQTRLSVPQHAVFTPDGQRLLVVNWAGETFNAYARQADGRYAAHPTAVTPFPTSMAGYKPHGMEIAPSGRFVAVAFGAAAAYPKALATFRYERDGDRLTLAALVQGAGLPGIPKGICFSPDETCLLATFSNAGCIGLYDFDADTGAVAERPRQLLRSDALCRPEDIKVDHGSRHVIVSNSGANTVAFFRFDAGTNRIVGDAPEHVLHDGPAVLDFPHGLAVSPDGSFLVVSQFGPIATTPDEDIVFDRRTPVSQARIGVYGRRGRGRRRWPMPWLRLLWYVRDRLERRS